MLYIKIRGPSTCNLDWHYVITQYKRGARIDGLLGARARARARARVRARTRASG